MVLSKQLFPNFIYDFLSFKLFLRSLSRAGKLQKVEHRFFKSLILLKFKLRLNPLLVFLFLLSEVRVLITLKSIRLGSKVFNVPVPLNSQKQISLSLRLIVSSIIESSQPVSLTRKLYLEMFFLLQKKSTVYKKVQECYKKAFINRAFSHYR